MPGNSPPIRLPEQRTGPRGKPRRIGIEMEITGLELNDIAEIVATSFGLSIAMDGRYRRILRGDTAGDWVIEVDFDLLQRLGQEERGKEALLDELRDSAETVLKTLAALIVPREIVSPPIPMHRLDEVEELIVRLRDAGAKGTSDNMSYAFGLHLNPEVPSEEPEVILSYLQSFLCLYEWLLVRSEVNLTRRITPYIDPFPIEYVRRVLRAGYRPDRDALIDDYLEHNPTRNRALDLLPLLLHLDEQRVREVTRDPLIKARPTFHYRLPNCDIDVPGWGLHLAWHDWLKVESLAADRERLAGCCAAYLAFLDNPLKRWLGDWAKEVSRSWLLR
jgi:hypothetical protein